MKLVSVENLDLVISICGLLGFWFIFLSLLACLARFIIMQSIVSGSQKYQLELANLTMLVNQLSEKFQIQRPEIILWEQPAFNGIVLPRFLFGRPKIILTTNLIESLNNNELEATLALCIAQSKEFRLKPLLCALPLIWLLQLIRSSFGQVGFLIVDPMLYFIFRITISPNRFYVSDRKAAAKIDNPNELARAIHHLSSLSTQYPLTGLIWEMNHLVLFPFESRQPSLLDFNQIPRPEHRIDKIRSAS